MYLLMASLYFGGFHEITTDSEVTEETTMLLGAGGSSFAITVVVASMFPRALTATQVKFSVDSTWVRVSTFFPIGAVEGSSRTTEIRESESQSDQLTLVSLLPKDTWHRVSDGDACQIDVSTYSDHILSFQFVGKVGRDSSNWKNIDLSLLV